MSESLFDDDTIPFLILINAERQYSIWPDVLPVPAGWQPVRGPMSRQGCLDWLESHWTDLRPYSLQKSQPLQQTQSVQDNPEQAAKEELA